MNKTTKANVERKYQLIEQLGEDWFGEIWEAAQIKGGRRVILRITRPQIAAQYQLAEQLFRDIKKASKIVHPNLREIIDVDKTEKRNVFFACESLKGETLRSRLDKESISAKESAVLMLQVLSALHFIHKNGLTHGYLHPENIFLAKADKGKIVVKLTDYSIVDIQDQAQYGRIIKSYISPEQALGEGTIDVRTDIFTAGSVLYEMLSGQCPYKADENEDVSLKIILKSPPPLRQIAPSLPANLVAVVEKAMANDYDHRCSDAVDIIKDIAAFHKQFAEFMNPESITALKPLLPKKTLLKPMPPTSSQAGSANKKRLPKKPSKKGATIIGQAAPKRLQNLNLVFDEEKGEISPPKLPTKGGKLLGNSDILTGEIALEILDERVTATSKAKNKQNDKASASTVEERVPPPLPSDNDVGRESTTVSIKRSSIEYVGQSLLHLEDEDTRIDDLPIKPLGSSRQRIIIRVNTALKSFFDTLINHLKNFNGAAQSFIVKHYSNCRQFISDKKPVVKSFLKQYLATKKNQYIAISSAVAMVLFSLLLLVIFVGNDNNSLDDENLKPSAQVHLPKEVLNLQNTEKRGIDHLTERADLQSAIQEGNLQPNPNEATGKDPQEGIARAEDKVQNESKSRDGSEDEAPVMRASKKKDYEHNSTYKKRSKHRRRKSGRRSRRNKRKKKNDEDSNVTASEDWATNPFLSR